MNKQVANAYIELAVKVILECRAIEINIKSVSDTSCCFCSTPSYIAHFLLHSINANLQTDSGFLRYSYENTIYNCNSIVLHKIVNNFICIDCLYILRMLPVSSKIEEIRDRLLINIKKTL